MRDSAPCDLVSSRSTSLDRSCAETDARSVFRNSRSRSSAPSWSGPGISSPARSCGRGSGPETFTWISSAASTRPSSSCVAPSATRPRTRASSRRSRGGATGSSPRPFPAARPRRRASGWNERRFTPAPGPGFGWPSRAPACSSRPAFSGDSSLVRRGACRSCVSRCGCLRTSASRSTTAPRSRSPTTARGWPTPPAGETGAAFTSARWRASTSRGCRARNGRGARSSHPTTRGSASKPDRS